MNDLEELDYTQRLAVIGMAGRFPGARNLEEFWHNLRNGVESVSFFSEQELGVLGVDLALLKNPNYVKAGVLLEDKELFDAAFFGYPPREAEIIDPQQRLFLECAWEALESAGYNCQTYEDRISVYGGASINSYLLFNLISNSDLIKLVGVTQIRHSNRQDNLATRVAYKLNLKGSALTVQTGCSTSLVAVHLACQSLLDHECRMALAGGVCISSLEKTGYLYQEGGIVSPDGHCRAFDARAQGTIGGDGVGIVVLKRLEDAIADGDTIHATIRSSAINNDGSDKVSYAAPSINGQAAVIAEALAMGRSEAETISYVETHGTGTVLGDPIEIAALTEAFRATTNKKRFCAIGSVKTNIGHLDAAAGIAGLIKTVLALKHQKIPPSLHFEEPNPQIDFANSPFYVNAELSEWKTDGVPRRAGVSSFGIGGTNAHVVLEEAPVVSSGASRSHQLLLLSAKTESALEAATVNLAEHLQQAQPNLADVAYTLQVGRQAFDYRRAIVCQQLNDTVTLLGQVDSPLVSTAQVQTHSLQLVFMFPGQGAQYVDMGRELYDTERVFREHVDHCCQMLEPHLGLDLRDLLYPQSKAQPSTRLTQTRYAQPALFVIEYALAQLWMSWGVKPNAMIGHSIGEYVAACLSGVFSLDTALELVSLRGQLMQSLPSGSMLAVSLSESELQPFLTNDVVLAAHNAPRGCVVSGPSEAIDELRDRLTQQAIQCRLLQTSHAFHSPMMDPIVAPFLERVKQVSLQAPQIPFLSNVTGTWMTATDATDPNYWGTHLRQTVRFTEGLVALQSAEQLLLEVGPGRTLNTLAKHTLEDHPPSRILSSLRHPKEPQSDTAFLLQTLGKLWVAGVSLNWPAFSAHEQRQRIPLPTYPFERQRYWIEPKLDAAPSSLPTAASPHASTSPNDNDIARWCYLPTWKQTVPVDLRLPQGETPHQCWLIFLDPQGIGLALAHRLKRQNQSVITVKCDQEFSCVNEFEYSINPQHRDDYDHLLEALAATDQCPDAVVHLWNLMASSEEDAFKDLLGFYSVLFLTQAIGQHVATKTLQLTVITNNIYSVTGEERLCPTQATTLGLCKVVPQEHSNVTCRSIDISLSQPETDIPSVTEQLMAELSVPDDLSIAYRGHRRWIQAFEPIYLNDSKAQCSLRERGVYVITGGLGRLGLTMARYLAQKANATLILISRSELPERLQWQQWIDTYPESDPTRQRIQQIQLLEQLGSNVWVIQADVGDEEQMQLAIAQINEKFGDIHGVIHAAGITRDRQAIQNLTPTDCQRQFQAKLSGLVVLEKVFRNKSLDFCLMFSSLASVLGGLGFAAYAAANSFMDAMAHQWQYHGTPAMSINWDAWQFNHGMNRKANASTTLGHAITPDEGMAVFERLLSLRNVPQIVVSTSDLQRRIDQWLKLEPIRAITPTVQGASLTGQPEQRLASVSHNQLEQMIADIWQQVLGVAQVGKNDNFFDLGGNSLSSIQVVAQLKQTLNIQIPVVSLYERPTVSSLAEILSSNTDQTNLFIQDKSRGEERRQRRRQKLRN